MDAHVQAAGETPASIDDVSAEWLTEVLAPRFPGIGVRSFGAEPIGTGVGLMGLLNPVTPTYASASAGYPSSLIVKLPVQHEASARLPSPTATTRRKSASTPTSPSRRPSRPPRSTTARTTRAPTASSS